MYKLLKVQRSLVYYYFNKKNSTPCTEESIIVNNIKDIFKRGRNNYGIRKIKVELGKLAHRASRKRIARIMKENGLVSNYTVAQYKTHATRCNESSTLNLVDGSFDYRNKLEVAVSDLTYIRVAYKWHYVCTLIDLYNREIIGYVAGSKKRCSTHRNSSLKM